MQYPQIMALDEEEDIYVVLDEWGAILGTGTREVCEAMAELSTSPIGTPAQYIQREPQRSNATIRSAIRI